MSKKKDMLARVVEGVSDRHVGILMDVAWKLRSQNPEEWSRKFSTALRDGLDDFVSLSKTFQVFVHNSDPRDQIRRLNAKGKKVRAEVLELFKNQEPGTNGISADWQADIEIVDPGDLWLDTWEPFPTQDQIIQAALSKGYRIPPVAVTFAIAREVTDAQISTTIFTSMLTVMHEPLVGQDGKKYRLWLNPEVDPTDPESPDISSYVGLVEVEGPGSEMVLEEGGGLVFLAPIK